MNKFKAYTKLVVITVESSNICKSHADVLAPLPKKKNPAWKPACAELLMFRFQPLKNCSLYVFKVSCPQPPQLLPLTADNTQHTRPHKVGKTTEKKVISIEKGPCSLSHLLLAMTTW